MYNIFCVQYESMLETDAANIQNFHMEINAAEHDNTYTYPIAYEVAAILNFME